MFIFYVSVALYKLFGNCQAENNCEFLESCYFCNVPVCRARVCGRRQQGGVSSPGPWTFVPEVARCLQNLPLSLIWVRRGSRPKSRWDPRRPAWPVAAGGSCGGSGAGGRQWGPWWLAWPEAAGRPTPPARRPRLRCPRRSLQRSLNCAFRSALPDCSVPWGGGSTDACDKCLLTDSPSRLSTSAAGTWLLPTCRPRPPLLVKVHFCTYVHIK